MSYLLYLSREPDAGASLRGELHDMLCDRNGDGCAVTTGRRVAVYLVYAYPTRRSQTPVMRTDIDELVCLCCNVYVSDMI